MDALIVSLLFLWFLLLLFFANRFTRKKTRRKKSRIEKNSTIKDQKTRKVKLFESYDYHGVRIVNEDGTYTINDHGAVKVYMSINELPLKYIKMLKVMQDLSGGKSDKDYTIVYENGKYILRLPGGKKKVYRRISEIPAKFRPGN